MGDFVAWAQTALPLLPGREERGLLVAEAL
jgi:hypothetical protein